MRVMVVEQGEDTGLLELLSQQDQALVCNADDMLVKLKEFSPELVLVDINLPPRGGLWAARQLLQRNTELALLLLTQRPSDRYLQEAVMIGARGYLVRAHCSLESLKQTVKKVGDGLYGLSPRLARADASLELSEEEEDMAKRLKTLSEKEREALMLKFQGFSAGETADKLLFKAESTIRKQLEVARSKLDANYDNVKFEKYRRLAIKLGWI